MFGINQNGVNTYAKISMETGVLAARPNKLIILLYEGDIAAFRSADTYMQSKDIANKGAMLSKAISIIESGLRLSLNKKAGGEFALSLGAIYAYMSNRLMPTNIKNHPKSWNAYDSLAEAYGNDGDKTKSKENYRLALKNSPPDDQVKRIQGMLK